MTTENDGSDETKPANPPVVHAFSDDAMGVHDATELARLIDHGDISSAEVTTAAIERIRRTDAELHGVVVDCFEEANRKAPTLPRGAFRGVPTLLKDMVDLVGYQNKWGSDALANAALANKNSPETEQILAMGMNVLAKTTLPDFGITCSAEYPTTSASQHTRNPWNTDHTPGGSSSGSSAFVAAGAVPIAHGADGGGSIRIPASACGLVGMKGTRGRFIEESAAKVMPVRVVMHGVVTRSVRDSWTYLAEAEKMFRPKGLQAIGALGNPIDRTLRVGVMAGTVTGTGIDAANQRVLDQTAALLESLGHQVEQIDNPIGTQMADDFILNYGFSCLMISKFGHRLFDPSFDASALTPFVQGFAAHTQANLTKLPGAWKRLRASSAQAAEMFKRNDIVLTPTVGQVPPPIGHLDTNLDYDELIGRVSQWACFTPWDNATGAPAVSLPLGHDEPSNLPIGMMFHAAHGQERMLLELSLQLEAAQPWRRIDTI